MELFNLDLGPVASVLVILAAAFIGFGLIATVTLVLATVMRRALGVPVGWPRTFIVALLVVISTVAILFAVLQRFSGTSPQPLGAVNFGSGLLLMSIAAIWMLGFGAALLMVLEMITPTGSLPNPVTVLAGHRGRRGRNRRYRQVLSIFVRYGLASGAGRRRDIPRKLRRALEEAGTTFVKLGQNLSTREDVLPASFIRELSLLQTEAAPTSWETIGGALRDELGCDPEEVFARVDHTPTAAASVAQVHRARLFDGTEVVLKVQRPGTREEVNRDSEIVLRVAAWLDRNTGWGRDLGIKHLAQSFTSSLQEELDYDVEAANMEDLATALADDPIAVPAVHREFSTSRLLVMDFVEGTTIGRAGAELQQLTPETRSALAHQLMTSVLKQIMEHGIFHADVHPGNVVLAPGEEGPSLALLDFGAVGRIDRRTQQSLATLFAAIDSGDARLVTDTLKDILGRPARLDEYALEREVANLLARYGSGLHGGVTRMVNDVMTMVLDFKFSIPGPVASALRSLAGGEGTLSLIDPGFDIVDAARSGATDLVKGQFKLGDIKNTIQSVAMESLPIARELPRKVNAITDDLQKGRLSVNVRVFADPSDRSFLTRLLQQFTIAILAGFCVLGGVVLLAFGDSGAMVTEYLSWLQALGYIVLFAGFMLALRIVTMVVYKEDNEGD